MPDCACTQIFISGKLPRSKIVDLIEAAENDGAMIDWDEHPDDDEKIELIEECATDKRPLFLGNSEQPWGKFEALETFCEENGLSYIRSDEGGGDWGPTTIIYRPGEGRIEYDGAGSPMLPAREVRRLLAAGTLEAELASMEAADHPGPIEIIEDLADGDVLGIEEGTGYVLQWNAIDKAIYQSGETLAEYGVHNLTAIERERCGLPPIVS